MDYKIVFLLALMISCTLGLPATQYQSSCACGRIYFPICASNGETYNNKCEFICNSKGKQIHILKEGIRCEDQSGPY